MRNLNAWIISNQDTECYDRAAAARRVRQSVHGASAPCTDGITKVLPKAPLGFPRSATKLLLRLILGFEYIPLDFFLMLMQKRSAQWIRRQWSSLAGATPGPFGEGYKVPWINRHLRLCDI